MKILIALDGSIQSTSAATFVKRLPLVGHIDVTLATVSPSPKTFSLDRFFDPAGAERKFRAVRASFQAQAEGVLTRSMGLFDGTRSQTKSLALEGHVADRLVCVAEEGCYDMVVVGDRGLNRVRSFFVGSVSKQVARHAPCSVLVARNPNLSKGAETDGPKKGHRRVRKRFKILFANDGSRHARDTMDSLGQWRLDHDTEILLLRVVPTYGHLASDPDTVPLLAELSRRAREVAEAENERAARKFGRRASRVEPWILEGDPAAQISAVAARERCDLIVAGHKGHSARERFLLGSVAARLIHHAPCPALIVRPPYPQ
jgi:nucleotide-binding universal stress UspA family protein